MRLFGQLANRYAGCQGVCLLYAVVAGPLCRELPEEMDKLSY